MFASNGKYCHVKFHENISIGSEVIGRYERTSWVHNRIIIIIIIIIIISINSFSFDSES
jgi:hypothetical protein